MYQVARTVVGTKDDGRRRETLLIKSRNSKASEVVKEQLPDDDDVLPIRNITRPLDPLEPCSTPVRVPLPYIT